MDLLLVRHGRSLADDQQRIEGGGYDSPLTEVGVEQARKLAAKLQREGYRFDRIVSSPLARAKRTAQIIAEITGVDLNYDERLAELHLGVMSGRPINADPHPEGARLAYKRFPEGESHLDHIHRVTSFYMELQDSHSQDRLCVVAHGGTLNILIRLILGLPMGSPYWQRQGFHFRMGDTAVSRFRVNGPLDVVTHFINDASHLLQLKRMWGHRRPPLLRMSVVPIEDAFSDRNLKYDDQWVYRNTSSERLAGPSGGAQPLTGIDVDAEGDAVNMASAIKQFWGTSEAFQGRGLGYGVWEKGKIVAICISGLVDGSIHTVDIKTAEPFRRRGHALSAASHFIADCVQRGFTVHWDCMAENEASWRLAEKLGLERIAEYRCYYFDI